MPEYVKKVGDLAECMGMSRQALYARWMKKPGFPKKGERGWNVEECHQYIQGERGQGFRKDQELAKLEKEKLQANIEQIKVKTGKMRGELIDRQILKDEITTVCGVMLDGLKEFEQRVKLTRKPELVEIAEGVVDAVKRYLRGRVE